jgi:hypothetical protein
MAAMTKEEIAIVLDKHVKWLRTEEGGKRADLTRANLTRANLTRANLNGANLDGASYLETTKRDENTRFGFRQMLPFGTLIMFKKVGGRVLTLRVPEAAARTSSYVGRKCRVSFAIVERAETIDGKPVPKTDTEWRSTYDSNFVYRLGEVVAPDEWDDDPLLECTHGIHCFITREEAAAH